ncbi:hypothetical protein H5410_038322 [Solanum commersonii]|uniref:Ubiquitin-like protease family profile domain-containing protein n=1 Tax=Solanum commersonii TaxID=4109 RepID=A0A9J5YAD7_SOLCO|nr:hypothetical protein H5410_038322 [Solanum commersonii]
MNVFGDMLKFLGQERFQQFLEQTPFGVFYEIHHIKIRCQLLRHLLLLETENVRDMFIVKINGTILRFGIKEFAAVTGLKCELLIDFVSDPSIPNRLIQKYFGEMIKVPNLDFLNKFKEANLFEPEDHFKNWCSNWFYECCHPFHNTVAIHVATGTPRILNWKTSNETIDKVDKHMTELKAYVDDSTKLIIDEIRSSRGQPTQTTHQEDDAHQHVEESEKAPMNQPSNSIDETVGCVNDVDIPGSSTSKPPTLDDYPDLTMTQIVELDPILNANTTRDVPPKNKNPDKYGISPYIQLSKGESSLRIVPIFYRIKHPFESDNGFEVAAELIDELNKWVFKNISSRKSAYSKINNKFEPPMDFGVVKVLEMDFFNIMVKTGRPWKDMISHCIRGFKLLANISWDSVDNVIIPVNVSESFHWLLVVFRIKLRCLLLYDSMREGYVHTKKVNEAVGKLVTMIPFFFTSTRLYGKRLDLDCGLYTFLFAEYISNGVFDMRSVDIDAKYHRQRYATIIRHYGKTKYEDSVISENEETGTVASKFDRPRISKKHAPDTSNYLTPRQWKRNLR